jgi:glycosyltransferase involved in cell wall biosynthesis
VRVLHVVATGNRRGAEMFASDLVRALVGLGVEQRVAVLRGSSVEVPFDAPTTLLESGTWRVPGLKVDPGAIRRLRELASAWPPDVVQAHGGEALKYAVLALFGTATPIIYRRIGLASGWLDRGARRTVHGFLMRRAARVVTVAEEVRREAVDVFHVPSAIVVVIHNGIDRRRMARTRSAGETRRNLGVPAGTRVVLSLGAISWEKDPLTHLRITTRVLREREIVHVWVGDGPMRGVVRAAADRAGLNGRLLILGSRADVPDLLAAADVLLFASRTEGMPAAVIEAGMAGVPVAGFALAGVPEVVLDGQTGILTDPGNVEGLAIRISDLLDDDERRRAMGRAARERCLSRFEIGPIAQRYLSLYEEVAGS